MALFLLTALSGSQGVISTAIKSAFPEAYSIAADKWFIRLNTEMTAKGVAEKLALVTSS
jgi:hypothetical protein